MTDLRTDWVDGEDVYGADLNVISEAVNEANNSAVKLSGDQTISGVKTFTSPPKSTNPASSSTDLVRKQEMDAADASASSAASSALSAANAAQTAANTANTNASNAVTTANNASATATSASTAASNAQTTANAAQNAASTAQTTANNAQSAANSAGATATSASDAAAAAQSTASSAQSAAASAQSAAATAQGTASTALSTANAALPKPTGFPNSAKIIRGDGALMDIPSGGGGPTVPAVIVLAGDGVSTTVTITHNMGTKYVRATVYDVSTGKDILALPSRSDNDHIVYDNDEVWGSNSKIVMVEYVGQSDSTPPNAGTLAFSASTDTSLTYTFSGQSDNVAIARIDAYDSTTNTLVASNVSSPFTRSGLTSSTNYGTYLKVVDTSGNTANSNTVSHSTDAAAGDTTAPVAGVLSFSAKTSSSITYTFTGGSDNVAVTHIDAYDAATNTLLAANVTTPYTRSGLSASTSYGTYLRYFDAAGNHSDSNTITQTTDATSSPVSLNVAGAGNRATSGTTLSVTPTVGAGSNIWGLCWVTVSQSATNGTPPTYDTLTLSSNVDGAWTFLTSISDGPFAGQQQGAVILFYKQNVTPGAHTLSLTISKSGLTFTSIMMQSDFYNNVGALGTPVTVQNNSSATLNLSLTVGQDNMAACGLVASSAPTGGNGNIRYSNGASVTGAGDYMYVQDFAGNTGGGSKAFTTTSSQVSAAIAVELQKAA